jgi:deoxycytidine triphosphate deaminase
MKHIASSLSTSELTNIKPGDAQPNAVDLRVRKVFRPYTHPFLIDDDRKVHRGSEEMVPDMNGYFHLDPGHYEVVMDNKITVGDGEAGFVITRSTLNRNGVFLTSGLYDSGYSGLMAAMMHVTIGAMTIAQYTRIGQYLNFDAQALSKYDGDYGDDKEHDNKYG